MVERLGRLSDIELCRDIRADKIEGRRARVSQPNASGLRLARRIFCGRLSRYTSTVIAAVVIAIAHVPCQRKKSILTSRAVFANHLPGIGVLNGSSGSTGCVRLYIYGFFCSDTGMFSACRRHLTLYL